MIRLNELYNKINNDYDSSEIVQDINLIRDITEMMKIVIDLDLDDKSITNLVNEYTDFNFPTITCGIITFNEEKNIKKCLNSLKSNFDEIILLDSFSTDETVKIAKETCTHLKVLLNDWEDDFSKQRNKIINLCSTDWIYFIDADNNYLSNKNEARRIVKLLTYLGVECVVSPTIIEHNGQLTENNKRLIPMNKGIKFWGKVHEEPVYSNTLAYPINVKSNIKVSHHGYDLSEVDMYNKSLRNYELTRKMVKSEPNNYKWYYYLIREMEELKTNPKDIELIYRKVFNFSNFSFQNPYYLDLSLLRCDFLLKEKRYKELNDVVNKLKTEFPECVDVDYYQTNLYLINNFIKTIKVIEHLENLVNLTNDGRRFSNINSNNDHLNMTLARLYSSIADYSSAELCSEKIVDKDIKRLVSKYIPM
ncbi:glycosyltransferase [Exiguobacterium sp. N5]|uniref:tetratricopeptide repeat-containing glycosyltransferase n=1 Tax=Exiguobacterium sp. N5 TaxID=2990450 RepID=UPI0021F428E7|nr:glycosyltransferase [Exiguobacterium sp. N5]MCV9899777.1 glycosyltransferase [Exiguobacterium sp. N5]